jgi:hypothetical protein
LVVCSPARANKVRVVGVRQAVRSRARSRHDCAFFEEQDSAAGAGKRERVGNRFDSLRVGDSVPSPVEDTEAHSFFTGNAREELSTIDPGATDLEMRRSRATQRTATEQRSPEVGGTTARARHDSAWRPLERRESGGEHARLVEHLERAIVSGDVQLIPRPSGESVSWVRPDLGDDAERAQQTERSTRDRRVANVEMQGDLAAALQMDTSRRMEEPGELGETIALTARRDRRELVPEVFRE